MEDQGIEFLLHVEAIKWMSNIFFSKFGQDKVPLKNRSLLNFVL